MLFFCSRVGVMVHRSCWMVLLLVVRDGCYEVNGVLFLCAALSCGKGFVA